MLDVDIIKIQDTLKREFLGIAECQGHDDVSCFVFCNDHKELMNLKVMPFNFSFPDQKIDRVVCFVLFVVKIDDQQSPGSMFKSRGDAWLKGVAKGCKAFKDAGIDPNDVLIHFTVGNSQQYEARRLHPARLDSDPTFID